ncbi:hypothetical protein DB30_07272 [Enhygromyxa salina]|uniref:Uncharacterized protein n=1 Tax=Enhygromyxa salina TaxID=215803 RepID=A0A0C2CWT8_9BACT|nr:hypothetical protein DB30_07272 [Enhygromyxa salina]
MLDTAGRARVPFLRLASLAFFSVWSVALTGRDHRARSAPARS